MFRNKKLSKEEYQEAIKDLRLDTCSGFEKAKNEFREIYNNAIHRYADILSSQNVTGDFISNSKNILNSFDISSGTEDGRHSFRIIKSKDFMDCNYMLAGERIYECSSASNNAYNQISSIGCFSSKNIEYSISCRNCSDCFGCIGLNNSKYCILNKQYSKDEYIVLVEALRNNMKENPYIDSVGRKYVYGDFYPFEMSPFSYNEAVTIDYFSITKEQAVEKGYSWKNSDTRSYQTTIISSELPGSINETKDSIIEDVIKCPNEGREETQCTTAFRITPEELSFYRQKQLPLPRYCPNCRHYDRLKYRNPMKLYKRVCSNGCGREFDTTYAPDRPEKVYCEQCYQSEVL